MKRRSHSKVKVVKLKPGQVLVVVCRKDKDKHHR